MSGRLNLDQIIISWVPPFACIFMIFLPIFFFDINENNNKQIYIFYIFLIWYLFFCSFYYYILWTWQYYQKFEHIFHCQKISIIFYNMNYSHNHCKKFQLKVDEHNLIFVKMLIYHKKNFFFTSFIIDSWRDSEQLIPISNFFCNCSRLRAYLTNESQFLHTKHR